MSGTDSKLSFAGLLDFSASIEDWMKVIRELIAAIAGFLKYFGIDLFQPSEETPEEPGIPAVE